MSQQAYSAVVKLASVVLSFATVGCFAPAFMMKSWREEIGVVHKYLGLFYVDIQGCGGVSQPDSVYTSASTSGAGLVGALSSLVCAGGSGEIVQGAMSWQDYKAAVCNGMASACTVGNAAAVFAPGIGKIGTDWCHRLQDRCDSMERCIVVNYVTAFIISIGCLCSLSTMIMIMMNSDRLGVLAFSIIGCILTGGGVLAYWLLGDETFAFGEGSASVQEPGQAFYCAVGTALCGLGLCLLVILCTKNLDAENSDEEKALNSEKHHHSKDKNYGSSNKAEKSKGHSQQASALKGSSPPPAPAAQQGYQAPDPHANQNAQHWQGGASVAQQSYQAPDGCYNQCATQGVQEAPGWAGAAGNTAPPNVQDFQQQQQQQQQQYDEMARAAAGQFQVILQSMQMQGLSVSAAFQRFDMSGDGLIHPSEFSRGLSSIAPGFTQEQAYWLFQWMDKDRNGVIHWNEFAEEITRAQQNLANLNRS